MIICFRILSFITLIILSTIVMAENSTINCKTHFSSGESDIAKKYCEISAEIGDLESQHYLGLIHLTNSEFSKAYKWHKRASLEGHHRSQYYLGKIYAYGWGATQNNLLAHIWLNIAASNFPSPWAASADGLLRRVEREMTNHEIIDAQNIALDCFESNFTDCGY